MKIVLVSHGRFSEGLKDGVQMLLGPQEDLEVFVLAAEEPATKLGERLEAASCEEVVAAAMAASDGSIKDVRKLLADQVKDEEEEEW